MSIAPSPSAGGTPPLVSAIVSTYNAERFIRGCLEDLAAQTIADRLEIIVIDSGSPQNEWAIVREFQQRYGNILYIRTAQRETLYAAWNRGIQAARGAYITNANTDDRHKPDAFERMASLLDTRPDIALVYADVAITTTENETFAAHTPAGEFNWPDFDPLLLLGQCYIGPQPMWRKRLHTTYGYFDDSFQVAGDWEFWLRLAENETFLHLREYLGLYLSSPAGIEQGNRALLRQENLRVYRRYAHRVNQPPQAATNSDAVAAEPLTIRAEQPPQAGVVSDAAAPQPMRINAYKLTDHAATMRPAPAEPPGDAAPDAFADRAMRAAGDIGWLVCCPHAFEATWNGGPNPADIDIRLDAPDDGAPAFVQSHQGGGQLTLYTGYQLQTTGPGHLWVRGPINRPKDGLYPLEQIINTVLPATITLTWLFTRPHQTVRFEAGEPFGAIVPYPGQFAFDVVERDDEEALAANVLQQLVQTPEIKAVFQRLQATAAPAEPQFTPSAPVETAANGARSIGGRMVDVRTASIAPEIERCLQALVVYQSPVPKARLGRNTDGGYVICDHLGPYQILLSGGIGDDNSFEMDFIDRYSVDCCAFDHSVDHVQQEHPRLNFIKKSIGPVNSENSSNLKEFISQFDDIFLKLDIEGGEFAWMSALSTAELLKFKQIVIEIHSLFRYDYSQRGNFLDKLTANHILVHFHANNCCGTTDVGGITVPEVFECTFIRKDCYPSPLIPNQDAIPSALDQPNIAASPDISLKGWPFAPHYVELAPSNPAPAANAPLAVVISIRNRAGRRVRNALRSLAWQTAGPPAQVIVVSSGSRAEIDQALAVICAEEGATLLTIGAPGQPWNKSLALNTGIRATRPDIPYLMTMDVDMILAPNFLAVVIERLQRQPSALVLCQSSDLPEQAIIPDQPRQVLAAFPALHASSSLRDRTGTGGIQAARRSFFFEIRGYDEDLIWWGAEDGDVVNRAYRLGFALEWIEDRTAMLHQWHPRMAAGLTDPNEIEQVEIAWRRNHELVDARSMIIQRNPNGWGGVADVSTHAQEIQHPQSGDEPGASPPVAGNRVRAAQHNTALPPVSCICLTYGRVALLEEAIYSFLQQDYPGPKELMVLNDYAEQTLTFDHPEVRVINLPQRLRTVGEKRNMAVALALYDLLFVWDDDDIYLPHRLTFSVQQFETQKGFFKPAAAWVWNGGRLSGPAHNRFHSGSCWSRKLFDSVRGYAPEGSCDDKVFEDRLQQRFPDAIGSSAIKPEDIYYIYRWGGTGAYHFSGFGPSKSGDNLGYHEVGEFVRQRAGRGEIPLGRIPLQPHWRIDYQQLVSNYIATLAAEQVPECY
ncbi:MAG: glycosyltransferase [Anaerolineae bacterium]|nr:glycosyltransferase [Anaerolineae bacterium]